jgi:hypothetical protein
VILSQMMSNHHHDGLYDRYGNHVEFREHFHKMLAKCQNALRGRWENFWATVEPSVIEVITAEDLLEKLVYIATNPVKDGLVEKVHHWPGPNFVRALLSGKPMKARRPRHFFRQNGRMPAEVELVCKLPDHFEGKQEFLAELERRIAEVEQQCAQERMRTGRRVVARFSDQPRAAAQSEPARRCARRRRARGCAPTKQALAGTLSPSSSAVARRIRCAVPVRHVLVASSRTGQRRATARTHDHELTSLLHAACPAVRVCGHRTRRCGVAATSMRQAVAADSLCKSMSFPCAKLDVSDD